MLRYFNSIVAGLAFASTATVSIAASNSTCGSDGACAQGQTYLCIASEVDVRAYVSPKQKKVFIRINQAYSQKARQEHVLDVGNYKAVNGTYGGYSIPRKDQLFKQFPAVALNGSQLIFYRQINTREIAAVINCDVRAGRQLE